MSKALYRKYRSKSLETIIGQEHITDVFKQALKTNKTFHAYLFTGPRGVGKTSIARILAHDINQLDYQDETDHLDIIEIDAASNNGVDDVRELREKALVAPAVASKKIYIIDEVHMLSKQAFNALLKILEEPPEHVVFILATTDADKLPATIISRTQRFHFRFVPEDVVASHLIDIAKQENIDIDKDAASLIARQGGGSVRDSLSLLDQLQHVADKLTVATIQSSLGLASDSDIKIIVEAYNNNDPKKIISTIDQLAKAGVSPTTVATQIATVMRQQIIERPQYATKIEALLDVGRSAHPDVRLLVILLENMSVDQSSKVKTAAIQVAPVAQPLEISASKSTSNQDLKTSPVKARQSLTPAKTETKTKATVTSTATDTDDEPAAPSLSSKVTITEENFDWQGLLSYAHDHDRIIFTMLNKCSPEVRDGKLILYTGMKFHKTKLDDPKQRAKISRFIQEVGMGDILIETIGTPPPPKDAALAKIAELMGGGEEVDAE